MDTKKFMALCVSSEEANGNFEESKEAMRRTLEVPDYHFYYDISGDGTAYYRSGTRNGVGYASCVATLRPDGLATVHVTSLPVPKLHEHSLKKLCSTWNTRFRFKRLKVENDRLVFESAPFDPVSNCFDVDEACELALSTIHSYASALLALEAGTEPWDLLDFDECGPDGDDDDNCGRSISSLEAIRDWLQGMQDTPQKHIV